MAEQRIGQLGYLDSMRISSLPEVGSTGLRHAETSNGEGTALFPRPAPSLCDPNELEMTNLRPSPLDNRIDDAPAMLQPGLDLHKQTMGIECHKYA